MQARIVLSSCALLVVVACGGAKGPHAASSSGGEAPALVVDPRELPAHPTFADVVDAARKLDETGHAPSTRGCLLHDDQRFEGDVLAGVRPLPGAPDALAARLEASAEPVSVLSAWGQIDVPSSEIGVVAFTTTTPRSMTARSFVAFVTKKGSYLRGDDPLVHAQPGALDDQALGALLARLARDAHPTLYVSAEAAVPLARLASMLAVIPNSYEVGLVVALPRGTRLPPAPKPSEELLCNDGLPAPADDEAEGDLDPAALRAALSPLHDAALACALSTGGRALLPGQMVLAMRIAADGHPKILCFVHDAIGDAHLRRCLLENARSFTFPVPSPAGSVDLQVPLDLSLTGPEAQAPLCH